MRYFIVFLSLALVATTGFGQSLPTHSDFKTDLSKRTIDLSELRGGGPPKDGIPAIFKPRFDGVAAASKWLADVEPVLVVRHAGVVRVYPFQILIHHEMVNDQIGDTPILASYCPLCNSAIVFDRRVNGETLTFGVSGMLRLSDMVMYDRQTDTLWQQFTGDAIVGEYVGTRLTVVSSQVTDFGAVRQRFPEAQVLNQNTGYYRPYGSTPYPGYEGNGRTVFPVNYRKQGGINALDRVVGVTISGQTVAHKMSTIRRARVVSGAIGDSPYVIFHDPKAVGAMDERFIKNSTRVGSVGVYSPQVDGRQLEFERQKGKIRDKQTSSEWNLFGEATSGPLAGARLDPIEHGVFYAFAWLAFNPDARVERPKH